MARSLTLTEKSMNYIKAARICGESHLKIICLRIIPNIIYPLIINASLGIASVIMEIAALSYLGVGVKDTVPEWGFHAERRKKLYADGYKTCAYTGRGHIYRRRCIQSFWREAQGQDKMIYGG